MTVENTTYKVQADGNDVATTFSFSPMVIYASTDIEVTVTDSDGVETVLSEGTGASNYIVNITTYPNTGSITYPALDTATPLVTGSNITIKRILPIEQTTDLENQGGYYADVQEVALDKLIMICLQQQEELDRAVKVNIASATDPDDLIDELIAAAASASTDATLAAEYASRYKGTSTTSLLIESASKDFTTQADKFFDVGVYVLATSDADPSNYMYGQVTAYSGTSLTVNVLAVGGSGTYADWTITVSGIRGATGATGASGAGTGDVVGPASASDNEVAYFDEITGKLIKGSGIVGVASQAEAEAGVSAVRLMTPERVAQAIAALGAGLVVQQVNTTTGALASNTTTLPLDDTIPTSSEGFEVMSLAVTPTSATNILVIDVVVNMAHSAGGNRAAMLFQDSGAAAIAGAGGTAAANSLNNIVFRYQMVAGTTSSTTFKVRIGTDSAGTTYFNGGSGARRYGGILASSITITEIAA